MGVLRQALSSGFNLYHPEGRAELARRLARKGVTTRPVLYTVLRQYWVFGPHKQSLIPTYRNCGAPGKERVPVSQARKTGRPRSVKATRPSYSPA